MWLRTGVLALLALASMLTVATAAPGGPVAPPPQPPEAPPDGAGPPGGPPGGPGDAGEPGEPIAPAGEPADPADPAGPVPVDDQAAPVGPAAGPGAEPDPDASGPVSAGDGDGAGDIDVGSDPTFGPIIMIEDIEIVGNLLTADRVIRRAVPLRLGEVLRTGDPALRTARFKVLALGYFRDVTLTLRKGSARGRVVLTVTVEERGTLVLNRLWFGSSKSSPYWFGADLGDRNFLGTGLSVGAGAVFAGGGDITGSRDQWATELRIADPVLGTSRWGVHGSLLWVHASEPYRVGGDPSDEDPAGFRAFSYRRGGGRFGFSRDLTALSRLTLDTRVEVVDATTPVAPTRTLEDGRVVPVAIDLRPGHSRVVAGSIGYERDTRADPVLPYDGTRFVAQVELGSSLVGGDYDFVSALARWERWWPVSAERHVVALRLAGGVILGDAPRFDRLHVADVNRLLPPRALGLVVATTASPDLLGTGSEDVVYGDVGGSAILEYSYQWFRRKSRIYGGDLFVGAGLWGLAARDDLRVRDESAWRALPIDLVVDAGLRVDTEIGVFELTFANFLGRVPL